MNNEQQDLLNEAYENYVKAQPYTPIAGNSVGLLGEYKNPILSQKEFINKIKTDPEFSEKWGLKIEERELSLEERCDEYILKDISNMKKILYVILHGSMNPSRYFNIKETWGKDVDCLFYSDHEEIEKNIIKVSDRKDYHSCELKHVNVIQYVSNNIKDYEWLFFCDDDTFVNTKKLENLLDTFDKNSVHGSVIHSWPEDFSLGYCSGGAGYLIHSKLLEKISKNIRLLNTGYSDVTLGLCLREQNIPVFDYELFRCGPPSFYGYQDDVIKNHITFHYIITKDNMVNLENNL